MPKSSKKKKDKAADFTRAKLKLGKGKTQPSNAIDTSFKARSIALPSQSITVDKSSGLVTKRNLTFEDLLSHLKHYNAGTRKDAIMGLKELFEDHWDQIDSSLPSLLNAVVRLISDEDSSVRKQLLSFVAWLLPKIHPNDLLPHSSLLLLYTTSAQSHIFPEIRIDGIRFLDILLDCAPEVVLSGWDEGSSGHGSRALEGYLGILSAGTKFGETKGPVMATSTASVVLTPASKLVVLRSLSTFLRLGLAKNEWRSSDSPSGSLPFSTWFMSRAFSSPEAFSSFDDLIRPRTKQNVRSWQVMADPEVDDSHEQFPQRFDALQSTGRSDAPWGPTELENLQELLQSDAAGPASRKTEFLQHLADTLHSTIIETYLDCAPSVFAPGSRPSETELQLVVAVLRITRSLYQYITQSSQEVKTLSKEHLESILNYLSPYFPAHGDKDIRIAQDFEEFNIIFCELVSVLVYAENLRDPKFRSRSRKEASSTTSSSGKAQLNRIQVATQHIIDRLRSSTTSAISTTISYSAYISLLPTIWALISGASHTTSSTDDGRQQVNELLHALLDHATKVGSKSSCKRPTLEFIGRLFLLETEPHYQSNFSLERDPEVKAKFTAWLLHLPQTLWETCNALGSGSDNTNANYNACSEIILRTLLAVLQRRSKSLTHEILSALQARLTPYFFIDHATRGPLPGPYRKLPSISSPGSSSTSLGTSHSEGTSNSPSTQGHAQSHPLRLLALDLVVSLLVLTGDTKSTTSNHRSPVPLTSHSPSQSKLVQAVNLAVNQHQGRPGSGLSDTTVSLEDQVEASALASSSPDARYWMNISSSLLQAPPS